MAKAQILIVEDDNIVVMELRNRLQSLGYAVSGVASYGEEAIAKAGEVRPDLVLMDIRLKGAVDGIEAAEEIRARFDIPVVYLTAYADEDTLQRAKVTEPYGYVIKPFQERELYSTVEIALYKHKAEGALRDSEERFRDLYENAPNAYFSVGADGIISKCNRRGGELLGYAVEELVGQPVFELYADTPQGKEKASKVFHRFRAGETMSDEELQMQKADGTLVWISLTVNAIRDDRGQVVESRSMVVDITERKRAEEALRESEEKYRTILESIEESYYEVDIAGNLMFFNDALCRLLGYPEDELMGMNNRQYMDAENARKVYQTFNAVYRTGKPARAFDWEVIRKDGTRRFVEASVSLMRDPTGEPAGLRGIVRDVTERLRAGEALQQSYVKLRSAFEGTVNTLVSTIEMRDPYTAGHQRRVSQLACAIADEMGLPQKQIEGIRLAGLIHDLGKIGVPAEILSYPGGLDDLQYGLIQAHSQIGYDVLKESEFPWPVAQIVLQHHERMDGSGYPQGLSGEEIMLEARVLAMADVVEAMASFRPYRPARGIDKALEEISQNRGILYDPEAADACLKLFTEKGFEFE